MARHNNERDTTPILNAASTWIAECLIRDDSIFAKGTQLWTTSLLDEVFRAFVEQPDLSGDDFITKLKRQIAGISTPAQQLTAELLWALLLFPSNVKPGTKRIQISSLWNLSGKSLAQDSIDISDITLAGIGSGGPGFNNYRPDELEYLIALARDIKSRDQKMRQTIFSNYPDFIEWIESVPRCGSRQFRHMLRYFAFPEFVERMSSNNHRRRVLRAFHPGMRKEIIAFNDRQLDEQLLKLRKELESQHPKSIVDFYESPFKERWSTDGIVRTPSGEIAVSVPTDEDDEGDGKEAPDQKTIEVRQSILIQSKLARIGAIMGFRVWIPRADRARVFDQLPSHEQSALLNELPLNYDDTTLGTIEQIDVIWLKGRSIARAFEVEHTTAVYSGLLRMADLLALQPNMDIRLHIVAPEERREKVFREMRRPVFSLLDRGPLSKSCSFIAYESVDALNSMEHLAHTNDSIIAEYEDSAS